ncbi:carbonic anhydrase [Halalkalibacillus halophilus]|uniref:carbonic anhydrase n=1 Tax=Halalkalibacillus halophilus TaxID=392827 RepID=UPI000401EC56|nr:carbonic anhydrase [Halalkalibacillus halophilus]
MNTRSFGTAINCMDGRAQEPVINFVKEKFGVTYVDMITEAGPNKAILEGSLELVENIKFRLNVSHRGHGSNVLAIAGHHDCAGNPVDREEKIKQIIQSMERMRTWGFDMQVVGLYVNENWEVEQVTDVLQLSNS